MPTESIIGVIVFAAPFVLFALTLAYADYYTSRREPPNSTPAE